MTLPTNALQLRSLIKSSGELELSLAEVPVPTRYFPLASSASFVQSTIYGTRILYVVWRFWLHKHGLLRDRRLESLSRRYRSVSGSSAS